MQKNKNFHLLPIIHLLRCKSTELSIFYREIVATKNNLYTELRTGNIIRYSKGEYRVEIKYKLYNLRNNRGLSMDELSLRTVTRSEERRVGKGV